MATGETSEDFDKKLQSHITSSYIGIGIAFGDRLGLFHVLSTFDQPKSAAEIATKAKLRERYVREWLYLMVVSGIIDADDTGTAFILPIHRRKCLAPGGGNAIEAAGIPTFLRGFDPLVNATRDDGPNGKHLLRDNQVIMEDAFWPWLDRWSTVLWTSALSTLVPSAIPGFKQDMESGKSHLSIGCGSGIEATQYGENYPNATIVGVDIDEEAIKRAISRKTASDKNLSNVTFEQHDASKLPSDWSNKFDFATSIYSIHDAGRPDLVLKELYRVLKPGGRYLMVEFSADNNVNGNKGRPKMELLYCVSLLNCIPTALSQGEGTMGMGVCWGEDTMCKMLKDAGFGKIEMKPFKDMGLLVGILCTK